MTERTHQTDPNAPRMDCPGCGYNVGPTSDWAAGSISVCPECGHEYHAQFLAKEPIPAEVSSGLVVWHLFWPSILVFLASMIPMLSLFTMPIAVFVMLFVNAATSSTIAGRIAYHSTDGPSPSRRNKHAGIGVLLWLAQTALMGFAAFGGCAIAVNAIQFH